MSERYLEDFAVGQVQAKASYVIDTRIQQTACMKLRWAWDLEIKVERLSFIQEVARSIRVSSTNKMKHFLNVVQHRTTALSEKLSELSRPRQFRGPS
jgi:hypothetical protein